MDEASDDVASPRGASDAKAEERAKLDQRLRALTPHTPGMWAIVAVNLAVFVAMLASGVGWELLAGAFRAQDAGLMQKALAAFTEANARHATPRGDIRQVGRAPSRTRLS